MLPFPDCYQCHQNTIPCMSPAIKHHYELKEQNRQVILRRSDHVGSLTIQGHNNRVMFEQGTTLPLLIVNGFSNKLMPIIDSVGAINQDCNQ